MKLHGDLLSRSVVSPATMFPANATPDPHQLGVRCVGEGANNQRHHVLKGRVPESMMAAMPAESLRP